VDVQYLRIFPINNKLQQPVGFSENGASSSKRSLIPVQPTWRPLKGIPEYEPDKPEEEVKCETKEEVDDDILKDEKDETVISCIDNNDVEAHRGSGSEEGFGKQSKPEWYSVYGHLAGYETDIVELNDDNYIYFDEITEYDFTEYEPASLSSSGSYAESDSDEPCFQHYQGI
jgi:hypothetical protein